MGLNYNFIIIKAESQKSNIIKDKILNLANDFKQISSSSTYDELSKLLHENNNASFAYSKINGFVIIADELNHISDRILNSAEKFTSILKTEIQSTVDVQVIEFWKKNKLLRKYSLGLSSQLEEFKEAIPKENFEQMLQESMEIGEKQWFEKNGKSTYDILKTYGVSESEILDLEDWTILSKE